MILKTNKSIQWYIIFAMNLTEACKCLLEEDHMCKSTSGKD